MRPQTLLFVVWLRIRCAYAVGVRRSVVIEHTGSVGATSPVVVRRVNRPHEKQLPDVVDTIFQASRDEHSSLPDLFGHDAKCPPAAELQSWMNSRTKPDFPDGANRIENRWEANALISFACALHMANATHDIANDYGVFVVVVDKPQACLFDNWISAVSRIASWRYPIIAVEIGDDVHQVCEQAKKMHAGHGPVWLECVKNRPLRADTVYRKLESPLYTPQLPDYLQIGWAKVDIIEFVLRLGFRIVLSDLDNVFLKDPHAALVPYMHSPDLVTAKDSHRNNVGLILANPDSYFSVVQWTTAWAAIDGSPIQWQKNGRRPELLPESQFIPSCGCPKRGALPHSAVAVHVRCVRNRKACLNRYGLWKPSGLVLPADQCDDGASALLELEHETDMPDKI